MVPINHTPRPSLPQEAPQPAGLPSLPCLQPFSLHRGPSTWSFWPSLMSQAPHLSLLRHSVPLCGEIRVQQHPAQMPLCLPQEAALSLCLVLVSLPLWPPLLLSPTLAGLEVPGELS